MLFILIWWPWLFRITVVYKRWTAHCVPYISNNFCIYLNVCWLNLCFVTIMLTASWHQKPLFSFHGVVALGYYGCRNSGPFIWESRAWVVLCLKSGVMPFKFLPWMTQALVILVSCLVRNCNLSELVQEFVLVFRLLLSCRSELGIILS